MKIFCDFDGTLVDVAPRHYKVYSDVVHSFGGTPLSQKVYWSLKRKKEKWSAILEFSHLEKEVELEFLHAFTRRIEDLSYLKGDMLFPDSLEVLKWLSLNNDMYLVSLRRNEENLLWQVDSLGIGDYFKRILSGHSETDGFDKKIAIIGPILGSSKGLIIGDTEADIVTGKKLNLTVVAVCSGMRDEDFLERLQPDHLIKNIGYVKGIDFGG